jgi:hypothetical protein
MYSLWRGYERNNGKTAVTRMLELCPWLKRLSLSETTTFRKLVTFSIYVNAEMRNLYSFGLLFRVCLKKLPKLRELNHYTTLHWWIRGEDIEACVALSFYLFNLKNHLFIMFLKLIIGVYLVFSRMHTFRIYAR